MTTHLITSWHLVPLRVETGGGLVVEVTDAADGTDGYRDDLDYDLARNAVVRLSVAQAAHQGFPRRTGARDRGGVRLHGCDRWLAQPAPPEPVNDPAARTRYPTGR